MTKDPTAALVKLRAVVAEMHRRLPDPVPGEVPAATDVFHEAGHAVAVLFTGGRLVRVAAVAMGGDANPMTTHHHRSAGCPETRALHGLLIASFGPITEAVYLGTDLSAIERRCQVDFGDIADALARRGADPDVNRAPVLASLRSLFVPGETAVSGAIDRCVRTLAAGLWCKQWLSGDQAEALCREALDGTDMDYDRTCDQLPGIAEGLVSAALGVGLAAGRQR